jgi:hypothetical protein
MSYQRKTTEWPKLYLFRGERLSIAKIARKVGLSHQLIRKRMSLGWALEDLGKVKLTPKECAAAGAAGYRARYPTGSNAKKTRPKA